MAFLRILFVLLIVVALARADCNCPPFWTTPGGNYCYRYFAPKPWSQAENHCRQFHNGYYHGHLASIHSADEDNFLQTFRESVVSSDTQVWIGGSDARREGTFVWRDDTPFNYRNWLPGEPNNWIQDGQGENCLGLGRVDDRLGWNDDLCSKNFPFICKIHA